MEMSMKTKIERLVFFQYQRKCFLTKEPTRLCEIHFEESDILKGVRIGQHFHPQERWTLLPSSVPKHFLGKIKNLTIFN